MNASDASSPLSDFPDVVTALRGIPPAEPSSGFMDRVLSQTVRSDPLEADQDIVSALRAIPSAEPSPDFAARVLVAVAGVRRRERSLLRLRIVSAAAACLAAAFCAYTLGSTGRSGTDSRIGIASAPGSDSRLSPDLTAALVSAQRADGTWDVVALGGRKEHELELSALSLLALSRAPGADPDSLRRGVVAMCRAQSPDGAFGRGPSESRTHELVTEALAEINASLRSPELGAAIARARSFSRRLAVSGDGFWGYPRRSPAAGVVSRESALRDGLQALARLQGSDSLYARLVASLNQ